MDHRHVQQFFGQQGWQNRWQTGGQHAFTGPGRAVHQEIMPASRGDFEHPSGAFLPADIGHIRQIGPRLPDRRLWPRHQLRAFEMIGQLDQRLRCQNIEIA